jgi:hypothetical protein
VTTSVWALREQIAGMNVDNSLVRPHRRLVEEYREPTGCGGIDLDRAIELAAGVADLPSAVRDDDGEAKRFGLIVLHLQLCRLRSDPAQERLRIQARRRARPACGDGTAARRPSASRHQRVALPHHDPPSLLGVGVLSFLLAAGGSVSDHPLTTSRWGGQEHRNERTGEVGGVWWCGRGLGK